MITHEAQPRERHRLALAEGLLPRILIWLVALLCVSGAATAQPCPGLSIDISGNGTGVVGSPAPISWSVEGGFIGLYCGDGLGGNFTAILSWTLEDTGFFGTACVGFAPGGDPSQAPTSGVYEWVPIAPGTYQITGGVQCCYGCTVFSNPISISVNCPPIGISLESPDGGELLLAGAVVPITWTTSGGAISSISIEYQLLGQETWTTIVDAAPNGGLWYWTVPTLAAETPALLRITATPSCGGAPLSDTSYGSFTLVPTIDDPLRCTADIFDPANGQVLRANLCGDCDDDSRCGPCWECHDGHCRPKLDVCDQKPESCSVTYPIGFCGACFEVQSCESDECCIDGHCVPDGTGLCEPPNDDEIAADLLVDAIWEVLGAFIEPLIPPVLHLTPNTRNPQAAAYRMFTFPVHSTWCCFEYKLVNPSGAEKPTFSFGSQPLWVPPVVTPLALGEWTREFVYVGDLVGQRDALTFALVPSTEPTPGDELLVRNVRIYGPGHIFCAGDLNNDGKVDGADLGQLLGAWGTSGGGDVNGDGTTDGADLGLMLGSWGGCGGAP